MGTFSSALLAFHAAKHGKLCALNSNTHPASARHPVLHGTAVPHSSFLYAPSAATGLTVTYFREATQQKHHMSYHTIP